MALTIHKNTCIGDGRCVEACPIQILKMDPEKKIPEFIDGGEQACIHCGHCFAVCPVGAITLSSMDPQQALAVDPLRLPGKEEAKLFLKGRRSIRCYSHEPVSKKTVEELLDVARYAPSGINRQPVNWAVLDGKDKVHELSGRVIAWMEGLLAADVDFARSYNFQRLVNAWNTGQDLICRNAPCVVTAYGVKDDPLVPPSCLIAGTYLELAAFGLGLGACWAGYVNMAVNADPGIRKFIGLSPRATAGAVMMIGYPKYRYARIPSRNPAKILWR